MSLTKVNRSGVKDRHKSNELNFIDLSSMLFYRGIKVMFLSVHGCLFFTLLNSVKMKVELKGSYAVFSALIVVIEELKCAHSLV